jgi:hypothetical protein
MKINYSQAFERADTENDFVTSEVDGFYHQTAKDIAINSLLHEPQHTTLYELLEYAKSRSILKSSNSNNLTQSTSRSNLSSGSNSNRNSLVMKTTNLVQFSNQSQMIGAENMSIKSTKKIPIRISSLKRETKTAQTLR